MSSSSSTVSKVELMEKQMRQMIGNIMDAADHTDSQTNRTFEEQQSRFIEEFMKQCLELQDIFEDHSTNLSNAELVEREIKQIESELQIKDALLKEVQQNIERWST